MKRELVYVFFWVSSLSYGQSLDSCIVHALDANPMIAKLNLAYQISEEKVEAKRDYAPTKFNFGYFATQPQTRTGEQVAKAGFSQQFNWFGTLYAKQEVAKYESQAVRQQWLQVQRKLIEEVSSLYIAAQFAEERLVLIQEQLDLQEELRKYVQSEVSSSEDFKVQQLFKIELQHNNLKQSFRDTERQLNLIRQQLNLKMNRPHETLFTFNKRPDFPEEIPIWNEKDLEIHPEILKLDALYESVQQEKTVLDKQRLPQFTVGMDYIALKAYDNSPTLVNNGQDIFMPMLGLSIPIFGKKNSSIERQLELKQEMISMERSEKLLSLDQVLREVLNVRGQAFDHIQTLVENEKIYQELIAIQYTEIASGQGSLDVLIQNQKEVLSLRLATEKYAELYFQSELKIAYLIGQ